MVDHGFRLPMALDNRPLTFDEWNGRRKQTIFVSATPADWEIEQTGGEVVEQLIRPTGLLDPTISIHPARGQVQHLLEQIKLRTAIGQRTLVTTLTKRLSEDLTKYLTEEGIKCAWLHSELDAFERVEVLRNLREGKYDAVIGVNLLREGIDLPEVSLVAILDADKEGFLRSATSLIQTIGRSARNVNAEVILYADSVTNSMQEALDETSRRRILQMDYNEQHGITPETIKKAIRRGIEEEIEAKRLAQTVVGVESESQYVTQEYLNELEAEMLAAAEALEFERAAKLRDRIVQLKQQIGKTIPAENDSSPQQKGAKRGRKGSKRKPNPHR